MKHIIAILLISGFTLNTVQAQSKGVLAKSYFLKAQQAYSEGENQHALENLDRTVAYLGATNAKIEALYVKIAIGQKYFILADNHLKNYFKKADESRSDYMEMLDYVAEVKEKVKTEINSDVETQYLETAIFAAGVFWGVEYLFQDVEGVIATKVGYIGGQKENPTYKEVSNLRTKHAEAVKVIYDIRATSYKELCKYFFEIHDPTQKGRQGPEIGNQFRSGLFYVATAQKEIAEKLKERLKNKGLNITTEITRATIFWPAEDYHQKWHTKEETKPHWHKYTKRFD